MRIYRRSIIKEEEEMRRVAAYREEREKKLEHVH